MLRVVEQVAAAGKRRIAEVPQCGVTAVGDLSKFREYLRPCAIELLHLVIDGRVDEQNTCAPAGGCSDQLLEVLHRFRFNIKSRTVGMGVLESFEVLAPTGVSRLEPLDANVLWGPARQFGYAEEPVESHIVDRITVKRQVSRFPPAAIDLPERVVDRRFAQVWNVDVRKRQTMSAGDEREGVQVVDQQRRRLVMTQVRLEHCQLHIRL